MFVEFFYVISVIYILFDKIGHFYLFSFLGLYFVLRKNTPNSLGPWTVHLFKVVGAPGAQNLTRGPPVCRTGPPPESRFPFRLFIHYPKDPCLSVDPNAIYFGLVAPRVSGDLDVSTYEVY